MKATVDRKKFLEVIGKVNHVVRAKATLPIITNVLLQAEGGKLTVIGTDLESFLVGTCKAKVAKVGGICISPKSAEAFLKAVDAETITIATETKITKETRSLPPKYNSERHDYEEYEEQPGEEYERTITSTILTAGNASMHPASFLAEDFPPVPECKADKAKVIGLVEALKRVSYAVAKEATRPVLTGVSFKPNESKLELAAADGFRLAVTSVKGTITSQVVVPYKAVSLLEHAMPNTNSIRVEAAVLSEGENPIVTMPAVVQFEGDGLVLTVRATNGTFPDYRQLIPKGGVTLRIQQADMLKALKVVGSIKPDGGIVSLVAGGKGQLALSCKQDEATTEVKIPAIGKKCRTAANIVYLTEMFQKLEGEVRMWVGTPSSPIKVEHKGTTHIVMPIFV